MFYTIAKPKKIILMVMLFIFVIESGFSATHPKKPKSTKTYTRVISSKKSVKPVKAVKKAAVRKKSHKKIAVKKTRHITAQRHVRIVQKPIKPGTKINSSNLAHSLLPAYLLTSMEKNLVNFVRNTIVGIRYTTYKLGGTRIEPSRGIYIVDCSSYVDHILKTVYPRAYTSITKWSGTQKPTTYDFYHYFNTLSEDSQHWNPIDDARDLRPGDILVFRSKNRYGIETGHVMIVMDKPEKNGNTISLRIADSAPAGHSKDTRLPHASGIGIGTMLLKVDPHTAQPYAYAWKVGSRWESNVNFAMARPIGIA